MSAPDLDDIRAGLASNIEALARELLGEPSSKSRNEWRWGRRGSLSVVVRGPKRGLWSDHESGTGGDALALVRRERTGSFADTLTWCRGFLGMPDPSGIANENWREKATPRQKPEPSRDDEEAAASDAERLERARKLWAAGVPIAGTLAETYLTTTRRIPKPSAGWPDALRYHPGHTALMVVATDAGGDLQAVQLVYLTPDAKKIPKDSGRSDKLSFGLVSGSAVRLPGSGGHLLLAEGPETGLSVWAATGRETWIALGSMSRLKPPSGRPLVVCADDDPRDKPSAKTLRKAVGEWRAEGFAVAVVFPQRERRYDKSDFNDAMQEGGSAAVQERIEDALRHRGSPRKGMDAAEARAILRQAVEKFAGAARDHDPDLAEDPPPVHAVKVDVGIGKSVAARAMIAQLLTEMRARGDKRTVAIAVPTHKLGGEQAERFRELPEVQAAGLTVDVWRGRRAADPDAEGFDDPNIPKQKKITMCRDLDAVQEVQALGLRVEESCCVRRVKKGKGADSITVEHRCPFYEGCGYQAQKRRRADLWIVPHEVIFSEKPAALGDVAFLIVDEAAWQDGLEGVGEAPIVLSLDALSSDVWLASDMDRAMLREIHGITRHALASQPDGPLQRRAMIEAGLTADAASSGKALTWERKVDPKLRPGASASERREAIKAAEQNRTVARTARLFHALRALLEEGGPEASGWIHMATEETQVGPVRVARLRGRRDIAKGWRVPTLILDAVLDPTLLVPYWPQVQVTADVQADAPHMRIRQLVGRDVSKAALVADTWRENDEPELKRRRKNSMRLRAAVMREIRAFNGAPALIVAQQAVEQDWRDAGPLPAHVDMEHHNNVAGRDEWGGVRVEVVVGRTQPKAFDVEVRAEALTGSAVTQSVQRFTPDEGEILLRSGEAIPVETVRHPDPIAERIRWQICEGELIQIVGRCRGVNRTAESPVDVLILTDRPLPLLVDEAVSWEALDPTPEDLMLSVGGMALESPDDMATAYGQIWGTADAAKKAGQRSRLGTSPLKGSPKGECPQPLCRVTYQRSGAGRRRVQAVYDPAVVPDPRAWLAERLGDLAAFEPVEAVREQQPAPAPEPAGTVVHAVGVEASMGTPPRVFVLGADPPLDLPAPQASPPVRQLPLVAPVPTGISPEAIERLREAVARLEAVRPPRPWGDFTDTLRHEGWQIRCAAARARQQRTAFECVRA